MDRLTRLVLALAWGLVATAACAPDPAEVGTVTQPIYGGAPAPNDHAVFEIRSATGSCTATLIAPRTLLTANHCVGGGAVSASNRPSSTAIYTSVEIKTWYDFKTDAGPGDLALIFLDRGPPIAPVPWNWFTRSLLPGSPIRHVGYGFDEFGGIGERRSVTTTVTGLTLDRRFGEGVMTGGPGVGICNGDSGGPALVSIDGGVERVVAVHSYGRGVCGPGVSILLPSYRTFVEDWLRTHEDAGCPRDDRCVQGCQPADPDCTCAPDGQCAATCEDLIDPDCSASCRADGVCSPLPCPRLDDDCIPPGLACIRPTQCQGRACINDPQNVNTYCSSPCAQGCGAGFECDAARSLCIKAQRPSAGLGQACEPGVTFCLEGSDCVAGQCTMLCESASICRADQLCRVEAPRICVRAPVALPRIEDEFPAAARAGCGAADGASPLVALACLLAAWFLKDRGA